MNVKAVLQELESYGNESTKKIFMKHGAKEPFFGVKVQDMKKILKKIKNNHSLAIELFNSGNGDAMYLAGLVADKNKMTKEILNNWVEKANWYMVSEYTVPWIAADSGLAWQCGIEWINNNKEHIASSGWSSLSSFLSICNPEEVSIPEIKKLLNKIEKSIQNSPNRVRYTMNMFVISVGCYVNELTELAQKTAQSIGSIKVDMGGTACKVPDAYSYIQKVVDKDRVGKKRKMARC